MSDVVRSSKKINRTTFHIGQATIKRAVLDYVAKQAPEVAIDRTWVNIEFNMDSFTSNGLTCEVNYEEELP